jgi:hypothetical protein
VSFDLDAITASGDVRTEISDGLVALLKDYYGRGPDRTKTYVHDDLPAQASRTPRSPSGLISITRRCASGAIGLPSCGWTG